MPLKRYLSAIQKNLSAGNATEHTHRPALKTLLEDLEKGVTATNEPKRIECGAPDYVVSRATTYGPLTLGYVEAKDTNKPLDEEERSEQMRRYLPALSNLILTDYLEFRWYVDGAHRQTARLGRVGRGGKLALEKDGEQTVATLLTSFLAHAPEPIIKPKDLALRMARLTHLIRDLIVAAFEQEQASDLLRDLHQAFKKALIPDLAIPQFADMFAQTLAYGLFAARVNHRGQKPFQRLGAAVEIPKTNPFLRNLFDQITGVKLNDEPYVGFVDDLVQLLAHTDIESVLADFGKRTRQEDPVVHFYETFLAAYDPRLRKTRGVYYTPEPIVSYIVRSVDRLLKTTFQCPGGLADLATVNFTRQDDDRESHSETAPHVLILDPACGTGTFLYAVVDHIRDEFIKRGEAGLWTGFVKKHLLPRLFGFELLMAPYAVAHLKLGMQLAAQDLDVAIRKDWAYDFSSRERLGVYLTNTLEEAEKKAETLFGPLRIISEEANAAALAKRDLPIMVVLGNPPYSNFGRMNKGKWILDLLEDYKNGLREKKLNLDDDFIKFIRFGQWRIDRTGTGILVFITNNAYIDGITHRRMRQSLMETFTSIYILNLHGNSRKGECAPDGGRDENVFDIQQGVAIGIFVKEPGKSVPAKVHHADLWGPRESKYEQLLETNVATTKWTELDPKPEMFYFVQKDWSVGGEYRVGWSLPEALPAYQNGLKTDRDDLFFDFDHNELGARIKTFYSAHGMDQAFREKYGIRDSSSYDLLSRRVKTSFDKANIHRCLYRPFDIRWLYYALGLTSRPAWEVMRHMLPGGNIGLLTTRQTSDNWDVLATRVIAGHKSLAAYDINSLFPLYLSPAAEGEKSGQKSFLDTQLGSGPGGRRPNLNPKFTADVVGRLGLSFVADGTGDLQKTLGPEDIFHYLYAVLHSPTYRSRYAEFLKIDFPRVPLTSDLSLFRNLVAKGEDLVALHLIESPLLSAHLPRYPVKGDNRVENGYPRYLDSGGRVYISKDQYFEDVPPEVWSFHIGGYQVCEKWLKDRRGRPLSYDDLSHYQKIIVALKETIRLMTEIDQLIPSWPLM